MLSILSLKASPNEQGGIILNGNIPGLAQTSLGTGRPGVKGTCKGEGVSVICHWLPVILVTHPPAPGANSTHRGKIITAGGSFLHLPALGPRPPPQHRTAAFSPEGVPEGAQMLPSCHIVRGAESLKASDSGRRILSIPWGNLNLVLLREALKDCDTGLGHTPTLGNKFVILINTSSLVGKKKNLFLE